MVFVIYKTVEVVSPSLAYPAVKGTPCNVNTGDDTGGLGGLLAFCANDRWFDFESGRYPAFWVYFFSCISTGFYILSNWVSELEFCFRYCSLPCILVRAHFYIIIVN